MGVEMHYHHWLLVGIFVVIYGVFIGFIPFYRKSQRKSSSAYLAFVIAFALEMFGLPLSMYVLAWIVGHKLPDGILWGHTLSGWIGDSGTWIGLAISLIGAALVVWGWRSIHKHYWRKEPGKGELVTAGIYHYIRHPQYTGFMLVTLGMIFEWATVTLLVMWPVLAVVYYRLARREERDMKHEFGQPYVEYQAHTGMFLPALFPRRQVPMERVRPATHG